MERDGEPALVPVPDGPGHADRACAARNEHPLAVGRVQRRRHHGEHGAGELARQLGQKHGLQERALADPFPARRVGGHDVSTGLRRAGRASALRRRSRRVRRKAFARQSGLHLHLEGGDGPLEGRECRVESAVQVVGLWQCTVPTCGGQDRAIPSLVGIAVRSARQAASGASASAARSPPAGAPREARARPARCRPPRLPFRWWQSPRPLGRRRRPGAAPAPRGPRWRRPVACGVRPRRAGVPRTRGPARSSTAWASGGAGAMGSSSGPVSEEENSMPATSTAISPTPAFVTIPPGSAPLGSLIHCFQRLT